MTTTMSTTTAPIDAAPTKSPVFQRRPPRPSGDLLNMHIIRAPCSVTCNPWQLVATLRDYQESHLCQILFRSAPAPAAAPASTASTQSTPSTDHGNGGVESDPNTSARARLAVQLRDPRYDPLLVDDGDHGRCALPQRGHILYPCAAGKTMMLLAIAIARRRMCVLAIPQHLVEQWTARIEEYSTLRESSYDFIVLTVENPTPAIPTTRSCVLVLTSHSYLATRASKYPPGKSLVFDPVYAWLLETRFDTVLIDEAQNLAGDSTWHGLQRLRSSHCIAASGGLYREGRRDGSDVVDTLHARLGKQIAMVSTRALIERGHVANVGIRLLIVPLPSPWADLMGEEHISTYERNMLNLLNPNTVRWVVLRMLGLEAAGQVALIFIDHVEAIPFYFKALMHAGVGSVYLTGSSAADERDEVLAAYRERRVVRLRREEDTPLDGPIRVLLGSDALTEGYDLGPIDHVVELMSNGESRHQIVQRLGRGMRNRLDGARATCAFTSVVTAESWQSAHADARFACLRDPAVDLVQECALVLPTLEMIDPEAEGPLLLSQYRAAKAICRAHNMTRSKHAVDELRRGRVLLSSGSSERKPGTAQSRIWARIKERRSRICKNGW